MIRSHQTLVHLTGFPKQWTVSQKNIKYFVPPSMYINHLMQTMLFHKIFYIQLIYITCDYDLSVRIIVQNLITGFR